MIAASQTNDSGRRTVPSQQQVQRIKSLLKWALTLVSLGFVAQFIVTNASEFSHLIAEWQKRGDQGWTLFALIACYLLSWVLVAAQFHFPLQRLCASIRLSENVALVIAGALLNYSPFKAGMLYRFYYFKKWHDLSYSALAGLQLLRILLTFAASGFLGIIVFSISLAHIAQVKQANFVLFFVFALMLFGSVLIVFFAGKFAGRVPKPLSGLAGELVRGLNELQNSAVLTLILFALIACQFAVLGVQYGIIFHVLGVYPPVLAYFVFDPADYHSGDAVHHTRKSWFARDRGGSRFVFLHRRFQVRHVRWSDGSWSHYRGNDPIRSFGAGVFGLDSTYDHRAQGLGTGVRHASINWFPSGEIAKVVGVGLQNNVIFLFGIDVAAIRP